ncbi:hypothetical protein niasHT_011448 [Heterodera trifolii]|uniref:Uncharacterized protein n=1 Tax=Heterodera trifolii TaxID=157864 RepID=A0ABD2L174_9BILA
MPEFFIGLGNATVGQKYANPLTVTVVKNYNLALYQQMFMTVEIDEAIFTKRKNNVGRVLPEQWVFGGICRETKECFMVDVEDRTSATLLAIIEDRIAPAQP